MRRPLLLAALLLVPVAIAQEGNGTTPAELPIPIFDRPVRYHFDDSNLTWSTFWYGVKVRQAFTWWESDPQGLLPHDVTFEEVPRDGDPDIVLWLRDDVVVGETCEGKALALGCANTTDGGQHWSVEIKMRREDGAYYSYRLMGDVTRHEIGHTLYLPHHRDPRSIMFEALDTTRYGDAQPVRNLAPVLTGIGFLVAVILGGGWFVVRQFTRGEEEREWPPLADTCPASPDGAHRLRRGSIVLDGDWAWAEACEACGGARRVGPPQG